tara:strand:+ start:397 stop:582 length:186 start_codon:yes stop_codon:yes gene_type:complete
MFKNCTLKYIARDGVNISIKVTYPSEEGTTKMLSVPIDNDNTDYQNILAWVKEGNTIQEAD